MARFCTTYDAAVYSLILALQDEKNPPPYLPCERLGTRNLKLFRDDDRGLKFARLSLISFGEKFRDDSIDKGGLKSRIAYGFFKKAINRAKEAEPEIAESSYIGTERINELQNSGAPLADIFHAYGDMAEASFSRFIDMTPETCELVRSISEYNFLVDMVVDYADDYKDGTFNGFKKDGLPTFSDYYDHYYTEFSGIAHAVTGRLSRAVMAVRDDSVTWNTLFKIVMHSLDTVLPAAVLGKDVGFHYFRDLFERIGENIRLNKDIKRLRLKNEKD